MVKRFSVAVLAGWLALLPIACLAEGDDSFLDVPQTLPYYMEQEPEAPEEDRDGEGFGPTAAPLPVPDAVQSAGYNFVLTVGGDCVLGTAVQDRNNASSFDAVVEINGYDYPFSGLYDLLSRDDLTLVNLEGPLTQSEDIQKKRYNFRGAPDYARILRLGSVEAVNLANNHIYDYGESGLEETRLALEQEGILHFGLTERTVFEKNGIKVGLLGYTLPYPKKGLDISRDVDDLRGQGCQIVVASFHWGSENKYDFTREQRQLGRAAIDAGADVVVGHHAHVIQGIEKYKDRYIVYSLGNLVFGGTLTAKDRDSFLAQFTFSVEGDRSRPPALHIIPVLLSEKAKVNDYRPVLPEETIGERIMAKILKRSYKLDQ